MKEGRREIKEERQRCNRWQEGKEETKEWGKKGN